MVGNKENRKERKQHYKKTHGLEKSYQNFLFDAGSNKESFNVLATIDRGNVSNYFLSEHSVGIRGCWQSTTLDDIYKHHDSQVVWYT